MKISNYEKLLFNNFLITNKNKQFNTVMSLSTRNFEKFSSFFVCLTVLLYSRFSQSTNQSMLHETITRRLGILNNLQLHFPPSDLTCNKHKWYKALPNIQNLFINVLTFFQLTNIFCVKHGSFPFERKQKPVFATPSDMFSLTIL